MHSNPILEPEQNDHPVIAEVFYDEAADHHALISTRSFEPGECIISFAASFVQHQSDRFSIQRNASEHIILQPDYLKYLNHSCDPNCFADVDQWQLVALKSIKKGDELTFFYPSTEWDMAEPFACHCKTASCLQQIQGAAYIPSSVLHTYKLSGFIQHQIKSA